MGEIPVTTVTYVTVNRDITSAMVFGTDYEGSPDEVLISTGTIGVILGDRSVSSGNYWVGLRVGNSTIDLLCQSEWLDPHPNFQSLYDILNASAQKTDNSRDTVSQKSYCYSMLLRSIVVAHQLSTKFGHEIVFTVNDIAAMVEIIDRMSTDTEYQPEGIKALSALTNKMRFR